MRKIMDNGGIFLCKKQNVKPSHFHDVIEK